MNLESDKLKKYNADLHIHTCLSPCADLEMSPKNIVKEAKMRGLDIIGICDHNSAENFPAVEKSADLAGIKVIGGIEITTREEVHVLALFGNDTDLFLMQEVVYEHLNGVNDEARYGLQVVVNEHDEVLGFNNKLLIGATEMSIEEVVDFIHKFNGIAIASHVDREAFSILTNLGFIPEDLKLDALEIIEPSGRDNIYTGRNFVFITSSDAHWIHDIGKRYTRFLMKESTFEEIRKCLCKENGREVMT
ncbi:MAG: PHP domain-containing protein [Bacteroidia bacterium]|nr:PHP domain-containing protein [Bacteroidia bacterium]